MSTNLSNNEKALARFEKIERAVEEKLGIDGVVYGQRMTTMIKTVNQRVEQSERPKEIHWLPHIKKLVKTTNKEGSEPNPPTAVGVLKKNSKFDIKRLHDIREFFQNNCFESKDDYDKSIGLLTTDGIIMWYLLFGEMPHEQAGNIMIVGFNHSIEDDVSQVNDFDPDEISEDRKIAITKKFNKNGFFVGMIPPVKCVGKALVMIILDCIKQSKDLPNNNRCVLYTSIIVNRIVYVHKVHSIVQNKGEEVKRYSFGGDKLVRSIVIQMNKYRTNIQYYPGSIHLVGSDGSRSSAHRKQYENTTIRNRDGEEPHKNKKGAGDIEQYQAWKKRAAEQRRERKKLSMDIYIDKINKYSDQTHPDKMMSTEEIQIKMKEILLAKPVDLNKQLFELGIGPKGGYNSLDEFIRDQLKSLYIGSTIQELLEECYNWLVYASGFRGRFLCPMLTRKNGALFKKTEAKEFLMLHACIVWENSRVYNVRMMEWAIQKYYWNYLVTGTINEPEPDTRYYGRGYRHLNRGVAGGYDDRHNTNILPGKVYFTFSYKLPGFLRDDDSDVMVGDYNTTKDYLIENGTQSQQKLFN